MGKQSEKRSSLYIVCAFLFPVAFVGFVLGFSFPVWQGTNGENFGLWQQCEVVVKNCTSFDFNQGEDWMIGVRVVEIFALAMFVAAAVLILYENCCTNFKSRPLSERIGTGVTAILGGLGGLAGIIVYVVKVEDLDSNPNDYGWAFALVAASSALAILLGIAFIVAGAYLEPKMNKKQQANLKSQGINGRTPHKTSNDENYELNPYSTRNTKLDERGGLAGPQATDNLPGFAVYNGMMNNPGQRNSLPPIGMSASSAYMGNSVMNGRGMGASMGGRGMGGGGGGGGMVMSLPHPGTSQAKQPGYYSLSDDRLLDPNFDLSEGFSYKTSVTRGRQMGHDNPAYQTRSEVAYARGGGVGGGSRVDDYPAYSRSVVGGREDDPYNRIQRAPRAGYNDPFGFDRTMPEARGGRGGGGGDYDRAYSLRNNGGAPPMRDSYYQRF